MKLAMAPGCRTGLSANVDWRACTTTWRNSRLHPPVRDQEYGFCKVLCSQILGPWLEVKVNYSIGLSTGPPAYVGWRASKITLCHSRLYPPSPGLRIESLKSHWWESGEGIMPVRRGEGRYGRVQVAISRLSCRGEGGGGDVSNWSGGQFAFAIYKINISASSLYTFRGRATGCNTKPVY